MRPDIALVIALVGIGTWALRYLPMLAFRGRPGGAWSRFLSATGPAAIAALAVAALLPEMSAEGRALIPPLAGVAGTVLAHFWRRDVAIATLAGAAAYGIAYALAVPGT